MIGFLVSLCFPELHEETFRSWQAPLSHRNQSGLSPSLTTLDAGTAKGYVEILPVKRAVAMQLCLQSAAASACSQGLQDRWTGYLNHGSPASTPGQGSQKVAQG